MSTDPRVTEINRQINRHLNKALELAQQVSENSGYLIKTIQQAPSPWLADYADHIATAVREIQRRYALMEGLSEARNAIEFQAHQEPQ